MKQLMILILALGVAFTATTELAVAKDRGAKNCPPGLARKTPRCVPPGLAKKGVTAQEWRANRDNDGDDDEYYDIGDRLDRDDYLILQEGDRVEIDGTEYVVIDTDNGVVLRRGDEFYRLPRHDDGSGYVRVGETLIRVDRETQQVIELIRLADLIF